MVYITGDMHGDEMRLYARAIRKIKKGDTLIVVGDFGFIWDGNKTEQNLLNYLGKRRFNVCFVGGTHENYDLINSYRQTTWKGGRVNRISKNLFYLNRGQIFEIDGLKIFTFGGGESPDREDRVEGKTWWRQELPSADEMAEGAMNIEDADCKVDLILTHEPPSLVKSSILLRGGKIDHVHKLNGYLEELNRACEFQKWYFGAMHEDRVITPKHTAIFRDVIKVDLEKSIATKSTKKVEKVVENVDEKGSED